jgi:hypothetical protein
MTKSPIELADLQRLARSEATELAKAIEAYYEQDDPEIEGKTPEGLMTPGDLASRLSRAQSASAKAERRRQSLEAWGQFLAQEGVLIPPRFQVGDLLIELYKKGQAPGGQGARRRLLETLSLVPLKWGAWRAIKHLYRVAEETLDAELFGVITARIDAGLSTWSKDISSGTVIYLRRRAWRFLKRLGGSLPELYPQFAVEVMRRIPAEQSDSALWVFCHICVHELGRYDGKSFRAMPPKLQPKYRAFDEAWKRSPDPLMTLLEGCLHDTAANFAIQGLRQDFPDRLRNVTPAWLARLAARPLESAHEFLVETLQGSPEYHQAKLKGLGLHEAVLELLLSPSDKARKYAIDYARGHAADISDARLLRLVEHGEKEVAAFALATFQARPPRQLGIELLGKLIAHSVTMTWASKVLSESFSHEEIGQPFLIEMLFGDSDQFEWAKRYIKNKYPDGEIGAAFWVQVADDRRREDSTDGPELAVEALGKIPVASLDPEWLLKAFLRDDLRDAAGEWVQKGGKLSGFLDIERFKGLVFNPEARSVVLPVLGNTKLVKPRELGLAWLLGLARRADPSLHEFAHRYLLENMKPEDFSEKGDKVEGVARLFSLALGDKEPEPVRSFAQTYLRCHHPVVGPEQDETKQFSLKQHLNRADYAAETLWSALFDARPDVRRFALLICRVELRAWGFQQRVYELAESDAKEIRNLAYDALLKVGDPAADPQVSLTPEELDPARIFALTESTKRSTREAGMEIVRKHYARLGGAERLGWLMQSADREVRLFAVRLLWEKHRPRAYPKGWKPRKQPELPLEDGGRFADVEALRGLLRRLLFGLPPGRSAEALDEGGAKRKHVSASVIKRNVIELVRDLGVEDPAFAALVAPVLTEFTGSLAQGEWQSCLAALLQLRSAHPGLDLGGLH